MERALPLRAHLFTPSAPLRSGAPTHDGHHRRQAARTGHGRHRPDAAEPPLDTEEAERSADAALGLKLGTTTRTEIDDYTRLMRGQVALFAPASEHALTPVASER